MKKRLFIAINLPQEIKYSLDAEIAEIEPQFNNREASFIASENWHFTIIFLGDQDETKIPTIISALESFKKEIKASSIEIQKISYGPPAQNSLTKPKMIWAYTSSNSSKILSELEKKLAEALSQNQIIFQKETRPFNGHITLARLKQLPNTLPKIEKELTLKFTPMSLDLVESQLTPSGAIYSIIARLDLASD